MLTYFIHTYLWTLCNSFITKYIEIMFLSLYCFYMKYITLYLAIATSHVFWNYYSCKFAKKFYSWIMQKLYNKIHLHNAFATMFFFYLLCISVLLLLIKYYFHALARLVCHVFKVFFLKWSWCKLCYILNWNKITWRINFHFNRKSKRIC